MAKNVKVYTDVAAIAKFGDPRDVALFKMELDMYSRSTSGQKKMKDRRYEYAKQFETDGIVIVPL